MLAVPTSSLLFALNKHSFPQDSVSGNSSLTAQTATIYITISQHLYSTHHMPGIVLSAILTTLRKHAYIHTHTLLFKTRNTATALQMRKQNTLGIR